MHFAYEYNGEGAHPHNFWLQLAAEWGLPAALLIGTTAAAFYASLFKRVVRESDPTTKEVGLAVVTAVGVWGIGTQADGYMTVPTSQAMSAVILILATSWLRSVSAVTKFSPGSARLDWVLRGLGVLSIVILATLPQSPFGQPSEREQLWRAEHSHDWLWPRFWQQGWIGPDQDPTARR